MTGSISIPPSNLYALIELLEEVKLQYRGPYKGINLNNGYTFSLYFDSASPLATYGLAKIEFDWNGNIYTNGIKYKIFADEGTVQAILNIMQAVCNSSQKNP